MKFQTVNILNKKCRYSGKTQTDLICDKLNESGEPYTVTLTTYTDTITTESRKYIISNEYLNPLCFAAHSKIKKDIKESELIIDLIPRDAISYFSKPRANLDYKKAMLIDINNAYPSVLLRNEIIKPDTFEFLMKINKIDRLRAIGMLATNKMKLTIQNGEVIATEKIYNEELGNYYFFCCYEIGELLKQCENTAGNDFLFSWFDGIYIKHNHNTAAYIMETIEDAGYLYKKIQLDKFKTTANKKNNSLKIQWIEKDKEEKTLILNNQKTESQFSQFKPQKQKNEKLQNKISDTLYE